jgi:ATP-dependent Clp protease adaptor protein ClpS
LRDTKKDCGKPGCPNDHRRKMPPLQIGRQPATRGGAQTALDRRRRTVACNDPIGVILGEADDEAHKVMITAHRRGVCVVAVFTKDVAETKATRATDAGRAKGYPLMFTTEPEE